jgi:hypothetical protein
MECNTSKMNEWLRNATCKLLILLKREQTSNKVLFSSDPA